MDDLQVGAAQLLGALGDRVLEGVVVAGQLLLGERQRPGDRAEHVPHGGRVAIEDLVEPDLVDDHGDRVGQRHQRGGARRRVEDGQLAEDLARPQDVEHDVVVVARAYDLDRARAQDVQAVALRRPPRRSSSRPGSVRIWAWRARSASAGFGRLPNSSTAASSGGSTRRGPSALGARAPRSTASRSSSDVSRAAIAAIHLPRGLPLRAQARASTCACLGYRPFGQAH